MCVILADQKQRYTKFNYYNINLHIIPVHIPHTHEGVKTQGGGGRYSGFQVTGMIEGFFWV